MVHHTLGVTAYNSHDVVHLPFYNLKAWNILSHRMFSELLQRRAGVSSSSDYKSYQRYNTRRLKKLRHRQGLVVRSTTKYEPKPLTPGSDQWSLAILLAERCWAGAMTARAALEADAAATSATSLRHTIISKLAKAVKYANFACNLSNKKLDFQVYVSLLVAELALEKQQWNTVAYHHSKVRVGVSALISSSDPQIVSFLQDLLTTVVDPALRLALSQEKIPVTGDLNSIAVPIVQVQFPDFLVLVANTDPNVLETESAAERVGQVQFRHHVAQVRYDSLAKIILAVEAKDKDLNKQIPVDSTATDPSSFDVVLSLWDQLVISTQDISSEINQAGQDREQDLDIIATYAEFHLLCRRIQRDAIVAASEIGRSNAVRLYDVLQQSCDTIAELPGVNNDDELLEGIGAMKTYFRVQKLIALAALYPQGSLKSLALANLANQTLQNHTISSADVGLPVNQENLKALAKYTKQFLVRTHARTVIQQEIENRSTVLGSLATSMDFIQAAKPGKSIPIADFKAEKIDPVAVKPVFYDIAYNYIQPDEADVAAADAGKKGLFGLFK